MKPIVYLAAYCGRWYSAKLNKAHTILISSFVIFRVLRNMTDVMQMFQTKYQLQVRATQNKRSYFVPFIEEIDHRSTKKLTQSQNQWRRRSRRLPPPPLRCFPPPLPPQWVPWRRLALAARLGLVASSGPRSTKAPLWCRWGPAQLQLASRMRGTGRTWPS